jgi:hypothetical protein
MSLSKETQAEAAARVNNHSNFQTLALVTPPPTPRPNLSKLTHRNDKSTEDRKEINASTLKHNLGIDDDRCGCPTLKLKPCRKFIPEQNRDQVEIQIESMLNFTQSSSELHTELDKLVRLVHCDSHNYDKLYRPRIKGWKAVFRIGDDDGKPVESVEEQIREVLGQASAKCAGNTVQDKPCQRRIGGQRVQNFTKTVDEIVKPPAYLDVACLDGYLKVLQANMYCRDHTDHRSAEMVASWKLDIMKICEQAGVELVQSVESDASHGVESPTRASRTQETGSFSAEISDKRILRSEGPPTPRSSRSVSPNFTQDPAAFWPPAYDTTPFEIISWSDTLSNSRASYDLVQATLQQQLDKVDQKDGYVYLYTVKGNETYVKIGYTSRSIETRHEEWTFDCNREAISLYPKRSSQVMAISHARRVEALCHAELNHRKVKIYCKACLKPHIEWFEISSEDAIGVIEKWSKWMAKRPYQFKALRAGAKWYLKEAVGQRAGNIVEFMNDIAAASEPAVAPAFICEKEGAVISVSVA